MQLDLLHQLQNYCNTEETVDSTLDAWNYN